MFANRKYEELSHPQKSENVRPIIVNPAVVKMRPHPASGTSPLASHKDVPPPPGSCRVKKKISNKFHQEALILMFW